MAMKTINCSNYWNYFAQIVIHSFFAAFLFYSTNAQELPRGLDARMMQYPAVSDRQIAFVYAGDIWIAPKTGGLAVRLSSPKGEEIFPRFSPDGNLIAYSANYDGNMDIYVVSSSGGLPRRITYHGAPDRVIGWYPDNKHILFASTRTSEKDRYNQLFKISIDGGPAEKLPVPYGEFGAISPDGKWLAYIPISVDFRTWKRYRGGMNPDIWLFNLETYEAKNLTKSVAADSQPMWYGDTLYFLSDRDENKRFNIWAYSMKTGKMRQVTFFKDLDVHFPSIGPEDIVFENGGKLYLLDLKTEKYAEVKIQVVTDQSTLKPHVENVSGYISHPWISPSGKRAVFSARGDIFTVPAENGVIRNLTRTTGIAERHPAWSPDGKYIAYFTDRNGEYELAICPSDGEGEETILTKLGPGFRYTPWWSPDSKKIVFIDQAMKIHLFTMDDKKVEVIDKLLWQYHGDLARFKVSWSSDSRWIAYAADGENRNSYIALYDTKEAKRYKITSGFYNDTNPTFDPSGKYLYYVSVRSFSPLYSDLDNTWIYPNSRVLMVVPLRKDVPTPFAPKNDEEQIEKAKEQKKEEPAQVAKKPEPAQQPEQKPKEAKPEQKGLVIDIDGFESRAIILPVRAGRFDDLWAVTNKLIFRRLPNSGSTDTRSPLMFYDVDKREEKTILEDCDDVILSAKGDKLLVRKGNDYSIIDVREGQRMDKRLNVAALETTIDPRAEWLQIFNDVWRIERDYFYDPNLHGVDWNKMKQVYGELIRYAVTRWDVNYIIGELIGELNASHTYRSGGALEAAPARTVGYLGVDFALENGAYRIKKIIDGAPWDAEARSPLRQPGVNVKEGDYLLEVNGIPVDTTAEPYAAFQGLADKPVILTVNDKPVREGARQVLVQTISSEARLRHLAWIESKRKRVEEATDGKVGYIYVPDTGVNGQNELVRQFRAQFHKQGLIIDERFNSGGQIPDRFIELLDRPRRNYWGVRDGKDWPWPPYAHYGPKVMLINGWSGSGGDCFPYYFRQSKLGPLIGTRTWGGLIGMTGAPGLIDGGSVTVPTFGIYSLKGEWIIEGHGVDPDIEVVDDPSEMAKGKDPQLEAAISEILKLLKKNPPVEPKKPKYPIRAK
jgi:tricorn protease